ncbi:hypothetical protein VCUG_01562 [Vavraia culicis subsp. floridensis]|uniref:Post-GPI attachment to proteins factor 3 n=1 Tax=Vavraia culicis (isolate floridensis) TaxID=948595 RepID=L2GUI3_VAVCU|nr:uncharacterized protein VCUG_01562 [Vavraia culicis subsp. floridensis]ELA46943.1 hypothetical protein VCUG_01562 [Vavraia culicis subsp. floridensis]
MIIDKDVQINTNGTGTVVQEYAVPVIVSEHVMKSKQRGMNINLVVEGEERTEMMLLMAKTKVKDENENASGATLMAKTKVKDENENASGATLMAKTKVKDENENASGAKEHAHSNHANNRVMTGNTETAHETEQAPFIRSYLTLIKVQCTINALTFMSSILLHINDTPLTKRLDYFFVLLSILHACHTFVVKLSYLYGTPRPSIFVSLTLFSLITAKHLFSFNPTLLKYTCALFISFFCAGMLFEYFKVRTPFIAVFVCLTILCVVVEGLDVRPIVFLVDSHAVWHFLVIGQMVLYYRYLKIDLKRILVRAGRANES